MDFWMSNQFLVLKFQKNNFLECIENFKFLKSNPQDSLHPLRYFLLPPFVRCIC